MEVDDRAILASKTFTADDQELFARLSGDRNPMHLDPIASRRMLTGAPVVHGMHLVLWCLEELARRRVLPPRPSSLQALFTKPVYVAETASIRLVRIGDEQISLRVEVAGTQTAVLRISFAGRAPSTTAACPRVDNVGTRDLGHAPRVLRFEELAGRGGTVCCSTTASDMARQFPAAGTWVEPVRLLGLAALSYLVGMECPGLHSIFGSITLDFVPQHELSSIDYAVTTTDERMNLVQMRIDGAGLAGTVEAFARQPPVAQMTIASVAEHVARTEFAGQRALIIGGSRGLGELTAKVIAAGGGHPVITYARGVADAEAVKREIVDFGATCDVMQYDAMQPAGPQLASLQEPPTQLYYFATSHIFRRKSEVFQDDLFREFSTVYSSGFHNLCAALSPRTGAALSIFYCGLATLPNMQWPRRREKSSAPILPAPCLAGA